MSKYYSLLSIATLPLATLLLGSGCTLINPGTASIVEAGAEDIEEMKSLTEVTVAEATNEFNFGFDETTLANLTPASRELLKELRDTPDMHPLVRQQTLAVIRSQARNVQREANNSAGSSVDQSPAPAAPDYFAGASKSQIGRSQQGFDMPTAMLERMSREANDSHLRQRKPTDTYVGPEPKRLQTNHHAVNAGVGNELPPIPDRTVTPIGYNAPITGVPGTTNSVEWTDHLAMTRATLSKTLQDARHLTTDERGRMQAILRVIDLLEGRKEAALEPVAEYDEDLRQYLSHQLQSLSVMLDPAGIPIPERRSAVALRSLRTAERFLSNRSQLDLQKVSFCEAVNGFGDINEFTTNNFAPDQRTLLYVEIRNMTEIDNGSGFETELQGSYEIFDATGRRVANRTLPLERGRCSNFRRDYYIAYLIYMPQRIQAGEHTLQLTIEDLQGKKFGQATVEFNIRQ
jgi:hypothetical protein